MTSLIHRQFNPNTAAAAVEAAAARWVEVATVYVPGINIFVLGTKRWGTHSRLGTAVSRFWSRLYANTAKTTRKEFHFFGA